MTDAEIARKLERDLLDRKHLDFPFLARSQRTSISYFLEMYADTLRYVHSKEEIDNMQLKPAANALLRGLDCGLRLLLRDTNVDIDSQEEVDRQTIQKEAVEFLEWSNIYGVLSLDYTAWSRRIYNEPFWRNKPHHKGCSIGSLSLAIATASGAGGRRHVR